MGFRFRKTIRLLPGVRLNISKGGFSTSIGRPGATINVGKRGVRGTVGLPGSGLSYSDMIVKRGQGKIRSTHAIGYDTPNENSPKPRNPLIIAVAVVAVIAALLFAAGLMSARQSTPLASQHSGTTPLVAPLSSAPASNQKTESAHVTAKTNCRANPNSHAKVIATISDSQDLTILDRQSGWIRITTDNEDCWVASHLVQ